jgi:hypothetical protein
MSFFLLYTQITILHAFVIKELFSLSHLSVIMNSMTIFQTSNQTHNIIIFGYLEHFSL